MAPNGEDKLPPPEDSRDISEILRTEEVLGWCTVGSHWGVDVERRLAEGILVCRACRALLPRRNNPLNL